MKKKLEPVHPGEVLQQEFMEPFGVTQYRVARETKVPPRRINEIVQGKRAITADTALRLARFFGTSELFWLNLQARYDLDVQRQRLGRALDEIATYVPPADTSMRIADRPVQGKAPRRTKGRR
jgi:addiction module HigA family antidote